MYTNTKVHCQGFHADKILLICEKKQNLLKQEFKVMSSTCFSQALANYRDKANEEIR